MRNLGANVIHHGSSFDESREYIERLSKEEGYRYIHAVNEPRLIAGVATYSLEIIEDLPDVEVIIVPVGGGGACGACIVAKSINPDIQVIGVQAEQAPAVYLSWKRGEVVDAPMKTAAEGLATSSGYELSLNILREGLDDFLLVTEAEMNAAIVTHLEETHNLTEHAGAASLAGALKIKDRLKGKKVVLVMSGRQPLDTTPENGPTGIVRLAPAEGESLDRQIHHRRLPSLRALPRVLDALRPHSPRGRGA